MKITVLPAAQLTAAHLDAWDRFQRADPALDSPYFRPEFTQAVAAVRADVRVALLEEGGEIGGFFPFQRGRLGTARPVGGKMCDFQGVIARRGLDFDAGALVRACGLHAWDFDHVPAAQTRFGPWQLATADSPFMDLSRGFDAYRAHCDRPGPMSFKRLAEKARKMERQIGPLRFVAHAAEPQALAALLVWKSAQYRRKKVTDVFAFGWTVQLLERVLAERSPAFRGMLHALYAGDQLAAVELILRSYGVCHSWFPAYNPDLARYSPGLLLVVEQAKAAQHMGVRRIDLGKGVADYKAYFMNGASVVTEGCVAPRSLVRWLRIGWRRTHAWAKAGLLGGPVRLAGRWTRPLRGWLAFR
jgi:CelD/BcsL family acetyltransferase involved in cellulose biosynthesis